MFGSLTGLLNLVLNDLAGHEVRPGGVVAEAPRFHPLLMAALGEAPLPEGLSVGRVLQGDQGAWEALAPGDTPSGSSTDADPRFGTDDPIRSALQVFARSATPALGALLLVKPVGNGARSAADPGAPGDLPVGSLPADALGERSGLDSAPSEVFSAFRGAEATESESRARCGLSQASWDGPSGGAAPAKRSGNLRLWPSGAGLSGTTEDVGPTSKERGAWAPVNVGFRLFRAASGKEPVTGLKHILRPQPEPSIVAAAISPSGGLDPESGDLPVGSLPADALGERSGLDSAPSEVFSAFRGAEATESESRARCGLSQASWDGPSGGAAPAKRSGNLRLWPSGAGLSGTTEDVGPTSKERGAWAPVNVGFRLFRAASGKEPITGLKHVLRPQPEPSIIAAAISPSGGLDPESVSPSSGRDPVGQRAASRPVLFGTETRRGSGTERSAVWKVRTADAAAAAGESAGLVNRGAARAPRSEAPAELIPAGPASGTAPSASSDLMSNTESAAPPLDGPGALDGRPDVKLEGQGRGASATARPREASATASEASGVHPTRPPDAWAQLPTAGPGSGETEPLTAAVIVKTAGSHDRDRALQGTGFSPDAADAARRGIFRAGEPARLAPVGSPESHRGVSKSEGMTGAPANARADSPNGEPARARGVEPLTEALSRGEELAVDDLEIRVVARPTRSRGKRDGFSPESVEPGAGLSQQDEARTDLLRPTRVHREEGAPRVPESAPGVSVVARGACRRKRCVVPLLGTRAERERPKLRLLQIRSLRAWWRARREDLGRAWRCRARPVRGPELQRERRPVVRGRVRRDRGRVEGLGAFGVSRGTSRGRAILCGPRRQLRTAGCLWTPRAEFREHRHRT